MNFSSLNRVKIIDEMEQESFDLLIIGGGITGAGIALDAASRGMKTALVEMQDFAAGTSSRSTKLIHGGLRYLKQFEFKMVASVGQERAVVYENGPHVTMPEWMILPIYENGSLGKFSTSMGLRLYDLLAKVKRSEWRTMLTRDEILEKAPLLRKKGLLGGGYYVEYRTDDARLTIEVLKKAVKYGAQAVNYAKVTKFLYENGVVAGVEVIDEVTQRYSVIYAKKIVNATGPWVDLLREQNQSRGQSHLMLTKGVHLVFDQADVPLKQSIYFDTPDGRMMFAIPRDSKVYIGTTDTTYDGDRLRPRMTIADRDYCLQAIRTIFPDIKIAEASIESSWAGLRPLIREEGKKPSEISRKDEIWESQSGLITIAGGKLTGYRKMAEMIVDLVVEKFKQEGYKIFSASRTKSIPISGGDVGGTKGWSNFVKGKIAAGMKLGLTQHESAILVHRYGSNVDIVFEIIKTNTISANESPIPPALLAQLIYSIEQEMVVKPIDFFIRRTGALFFDIGMIHERKRDVIDYMEKYLGWSYEEKEAYTLELEQHLDAAVTAVEG